MTDDRVEAGRASAVRAWRRLHAEQRLAAVAALLVIVSTLGPFSFVEAAQVLVAAAVLALLAQRAERREFHLPFGDGAAIAAAGAWCAVLIATRMFDRPPGQTALALVCAGLLLVAGLREHAKRPPDDLPDAPARPARPATGARPPEPGDRPAHPSDAPTTVLDPDAPTRADPDAPPRSDV